MADETNATSSVAIEAPNSLDTFTGKQRDEWLMNGTPQPADEAESAPAEGKEGQASEPAKAEPIAPATDTGKKQEPSFERAQRRKGELSAEIQDLLRQRAEARAGLEADLAAGRTKPAEKAAESATATQQPADGRPVPPDPEKWTGTWEQLDTAKLKYLEELTDWKLKQPERDRQAAERVAAGPAGPGERALAGPAGPEERAPAGPVDLPAPVEAGPAGAGEHALADPAGRAVQPVAAAARRVVRAQPAERVGAARRAAAA